jgi:hypothetical protein
MHHCRVVTARAATAAPTQATRSERESIVTELQVNLTKTLLLAAALSTAASLSIAQAVAAPKTDDAAVQPADATAPAKHKSQSTQATTSHKTKSHHAKKDVKKDVKPTTDATPAS